MRRQTDQCRYLTRSENRCTGEVVDNTEQAEVYLCTRHLGEAVQLLKARGFTITPPVTK
jgi:hypothetical protein